jgi:CRP/FNR family transcriptional regulator
VLGKTKMKNQTMLDTAASDYSVAHMSRQAIHMQSDWATLGEVMRLLQYEGHCSAPTDVPEFRRRRVHAGQSVFVMGQEFGGLYVVRFGALRTVLTQADGSDHVIAFSLQGDLLGAEGACKQHYWCETFALTECEVIRLPADDYFSPGRAGDGVEHMIYWAISHEVAKRQTSYAITHATKAEVRVARFLAELSERFAAQGQSPRHLHLPMTRRDIGSYLSVTLETVSRALSTLSHQKILDVSNREIVIKDMEALIHFEG